MDVIYNGQAISFYWRINRNASDIPEDFTKADLKVFFIGNDYAGNYDGKYYFTPININCDPDSEQAGDYVHIDIPAETLPPGTYCVEAVWIKNRHELLNAGSTRTLTRARKDRVFKVADYEPEASDYSESDSTMESEPHKVIITSGTTSYGYDGMSAYETAVFEESTVMSEKEWIDKYEKAENRVNYQMKEDTPGTWANAELLRKKAEGQLGDTDPDYSTSREKKEADRQTAESNRVSAENSRSSAETQRQKNEGQLGSSDPDYATSRIKKENDRQTAESARALAEEGRDSAETTRVQNEGSGGPSSTGYSTSRIKKELDRQSAESSRATAETSRQEYEGQGDYSDATEYPNTRRAKEAARQTAETARATAETARQKAEGQLGDTDPDYATSRIKQEIDRQAAEAARELAETARENAKISSTTIEYAVGDSGTTPPSSGWQSTVPSYTTGDFLWGRTTITFGDDTSKVLYAIGSVPDVAVSQDASTGKTTITVGSDSYDVATEPVSVSQNTETGGLDLNIGNETTNVASQNSITDIEGGNEFLTPEFQNGGMYLNDGTLYEISSGKYSDAINTEGCERMFITGSLNSSFSGFTLLYKADGIIKLAMPEEWIAQGLYPTGVDMTDVAYVKFSFYKDSTPIIKIVKVGEIPQIKSDIEKIDADIADIKPKIDGGDNFTFPTFQSGKMYLSDGSLYETSSGKYSGAINTANCERLFITGTLDNSFSACTLLYKADNTIKQYLEESAIAQGIFSDGVDMTDVAYIKFSFKNTSSPIIKLVRNGIENDIVEIKEEISEIQDDIMELQSNSINLYRKNLLNPSTCIADKYISAADGVMRDLEGTYATDFIEIKENTPYTFSVERNPTTTAISQWAYYNSQKQYISGELNPSLFERITRTTPANAKYVRMTVFLPNISMLQEGKIKTQFRPYTDRIVPDNNLDIEEKICTVHPTSNAADFNSILQALKETPDDYTILLKKGEYDMKAEYKSYYGADFFDNYDGYDLHTDDEFYRGYWLARGRKIIGESNAVIKFIYTGTNTIVNRDFSILNTAGNNVIDNITLKLDGCGRYHIHDDWQNATGTQPAKIEYKNLIFIGRSSTAIAVGAGLGLKCVYFFDNCIFTAENTYDISYHGSTADSTDICDKIFVRNCKGLGTLAFRWYGLSTSVTDCFVSACKFHSIVCEAASSGQTNENMRLTQWCNEVDE